MEKNPNFFQMLWVIIKWWTIQKFQTNIRCWFGHKYLTTTIPNVKKCTRCGVSTLFINAIYEDKE